MGAFQRPFSTIYVEREALHYPFTDQILQRFPKANIIEIEDYKQILNRKNQNFQYQKQSQQLILAKRRHEFLYPGTTIAPNFGHEHFYYNTLALNCLYNCEYCYLQGMFSSPHLVTFVNNEDFLNAVREELVRTRSMYLCLSYDTDLLAIEDIFGYCKEWIHASYDLSGLTIELRTKSVNIRPLLALSPSSGVIIAWTLTPEDLAAQFEHGAPKTSARISALQAVAEAGWRTRVCIDPVLPMGNWQEGYSELLRQIREAVSPSIRLEISIGTFRINRSYFDQLKKVIPFSRLLQEPLEKRENILRYSDETEANIHSFIVGEAKRLFPNDEISTVA